MIYHDIPRLRQFLAMLKKHGMATLVDGKVVWGFPSRRGSKEDPLGLYPRCEGSTPSAGPVWPSGEVPPGRQFYFAETDGPGPFTHWSEE